MDLPGYSESNKSVCREFAYKFQKGKQRQHVELVKFILNHPSTSKKIREWINTAEIQKHQCDIPLKVIEDSSNSSFAGCTTSLSPQKHVKCSRTSTRERELGNEYFKKRNLSRSLLHYNEAIKFASFPNSENENSCLPIAFANRSAVFNELGEDYFDQALNDADYSLKFGYPEKLKPKLLLRKAGIYAKQGKRHEAQECLAILTECTSKDEKMQAKIEEIQNALQNLPTHPDDPDQAIKDPMSSGSISMSLNVNENFENACEDIVIKTSKEFGRHVATVKDIREGDLLFHEIPFASVLLPDFYNSHCHNCHKPLYDQGGYEYFFPCSRCTVVKFCNSNCSDISSKYHRHECGWLELMHSIGIAHLAVRILFVAGVDNALGCAENHASLSSLDNLKIFGSGLENYARVYSLLDHIDDMAEEELFPYALVAGLLTKFLTQKTSFLNGKDKADEEKIGGIILRHVCQLICNAHAVTDVLPENSANEVVDEYQERIATAIYPAASIMNHSCDPNIKFYFDNGRTLVVKASRDIPEGKDVYNCYGPHFRRMARSERHEILQQQYFFDCACDKCMTEVNENGVSFVDQFTAFKCPKCGNPIVISTDKLQPLLKSVSCEKCKHCVDVNSTVKAWKNICEMQDKGEYMLQMGDIAGSLETFKNCYDCAEIILHELNSQFGKICDSLARCYYTMGMKDNSKRYLALSLKCVAARFGSDSIEFERESKKYFELFNDTFVV